MIRQDLARIFIAVLLLGIFPASSAGAKEVRLDKPQIPMTIHEARDAMRLVEFYESQMLAKTYLNIEPKNKNGKKHKG